MEQHPIPQHISSYEFRLVGDMTLKQFFQLAGGAVISLIIYSLPVHPIIKWPFIIFFSLLGAALAFLPFEERPLERWIIAFFRSVYSPTSFSWKKEIGPIELFAPETAGQQFMAGSPQPEAITATGVKSPVSKLESLESGFLTKLTDLFGATVIPTEGTTQTVAVAAQPKKITVPNAQTVSIPKMVVEEQAMSTPAQPISTTSVDQTLTSQAALNTQVVSSTKQALPSLNRTRSSTISAIGTSFWEVSESGMSGMLINGIFVMFNFMVN